MSQTKASLMVLCWMILVLLCLQILFPFSSATAVARTPQTSGHHTWKKNNNYIGAVVNKIGVRGSKSKKAGSYYNEPLPPPFSSATAVARIPQTGGHHTRKKNHNYIRAVVNKIGVRGSRTNRGNSSTGRPTGRLLPLPSPPPPPSN